MGSFVEKKEKNVMHEIAKRRLERPLTNEPALWGKFCRMVMEDLESDNFRNVLPDVADRKQLISLAMIKKIEGDGYEYVSEEEYNSKGYRNPAFQVLVVKRVLKYLIQKGVIK